MNKNELHESEEESACNNEKESCGDGDEDVEVFCHLGLLRALMTTPYADRRFPLEWSVFATFYNIKLYLINRKEHDGMDRNSSHYFKFEQYCFSNDPQMKSDTSGPSDDENKIRCIFHTQLKNFKLVYSIQVNGIESNQKTCEQQDTVNFKCTVIKLVYLYYIEKI